MAHLPHRRATTTPHGGSSCVVDVVTWIVFLCHVAVFLGSQPVAGVTLKVVGPADGVLLPGDIRGKGAVVTIEILPDVNSSTTSPSSTVPSASASGNSLLSSFTAVFSTSSVAELATTAFPRSATAGILVYSVEKDDPLVAFHSFIDKGIFRVFVSSFSKSTVSVTFQSALWRPFTVEPIMMTFLHRAFAPNAAGVLPRNSSGSNDSLVEIADLVPQAPFGIPLQLGMEPATLMQYARRIVLGNSALLATILAWVGKDHHGGVVTYGRLAIIARNTDCTFDLDFVLHPTQVRVGRQFGGQDQTFGCLLMNVSLIVTLVLLHTVFLRRLPFVTKVLPGDQFLPVILLLPGTAVATFETMFISTSPIRWAVAVVLLVLLITALVGAYFVSHDPANLIYSVKLKGWAHRIDRTFIARWRVFFQPYKRGRRHFFLLETAFTLAIAIAASVDRTTPSIDTCFPKSVAVLVILAIEALCVIWLSPFSHTRDKVHVPIAKLLEIALAACSVVLTTGDMMSALVSPDVAYSAFNALIIVAAVTPVIRYGTLLAFVICGKYRVKNITFADVEAEMRSVEDRKASVISSFNRSRAGTRVDLMRRNSTTATTASPSSFATKGLGGGGSGDENLSRVGAEVQPPLAAMERPLLSSVAVERPTKSTFSTKTDVAAVPPKGIVPPQTEEDMVVMRPRTTSTVKREEPTDATAGRNGAATIVPSRIPSAGGNVGSALPSPALGASQQLAASPNAVEHMLSLMATASIVPPTAPTAPSASAISPSVRREADVNGTAPSIGAAPIPPATRQPLSGSGDRFDLDVFLNSVLGGDSNSNDWSSAPFPSDGSRASAANPSSRLPLAPMLPMVVPAR